MSVYFNKGIVYGRDILGSLNESVTKEDLQTETTLIFECIHGIFSLREILHILLNEYEFNFVCKSLKIKTQKGSKLILQVLYKKEVWRFMERIVDSNGDYVLKINSLVFLVYKHDSYVGRFIHKPSIVSNAQSIQDAIHCKMILDETKSPTENMLDIIKSIEEIECISGEKLSGVICGISLEMDATNLVLNNFAILTIDGIYTQNLLNSFRNLWRHAEVSQYITVFVSEEKYNQHTKNTDKTELLLDMLNSHFYHEKN